MLPVGKIGIPAVRDLIVAIAQSLHIGALDPKDAAGRLYELLPHMRRNRPAHTHQNKKKVNGAITAEIVREVWKLHLEGWPSVSIARHLKIGDGRVSEILHGLRTEERPNG